MHTSKAIAKRFRDLDFHDDTFVSMTVLPAQALGDVTGSVIELRLSAFQSRTKRLLRFIGCANLRVGLDFDVLASNLPPNTSGVEAHFDPDLLREMMQAQKRDWNVDYQKMRSPLDNKLEELEALVCFRVQFCGGVIEVIAREFRLEEGDEASGVL